MNQLIIQLTGEIQRSNFDEWKNELITQIQSISTELTTDDDFIAATRYVKLFKTAEKSLKDAKQSAIQQASSIQKLFAAIDEISEEARQARLSLERQIKARKLEIKEGWIQSGIRAIQAFIDQQNEDFQIVNHSSYLNRTRFELAVKGKGGMKGIQTAIESLCDKIMLEISQKATEVTSNAVNIDSLPDQYKPLFQDRSSLLALTPQELTLTIDKRIALLREEHARKKAEQALDELKKIEAVELNFEDSVHNESLDRLAKERYRLIVEIVSSKETAIEIARSIRRAYSQNDAISDIRLTRYHDW